MNMFEYAAKTQLRFDSVQGQLTVEDLWDLPLVHKTRANLDDVAKTCHRALKAFEEESFVAPIKQVGVQSATIRLDIVKHIIEVKLKEIEANKAAMANRAKKQRILEIISNKQDEALSSKSLEELNAMVAEL